MDIRLYDTLTREKRVFVPRDPARVTMYVCGPTVYGPAHIGNARPAVVFDVLNRLLRHRYGDGAVVYARNVTDIDDKIMAAAARDGETTEAVAARWEARYLADMGALGVRPPDLAPHATDYVPAMIAMIERLIGKGAAYVAEGHVLFDVGAWPNYPALSRQTLDQMRAGSRVEIAPYKRGDFDFVMWKPSSDDQPGWESPWGRGRPGWHIECSAMIAAELGETIDIHAGGLDLIFPHHENEVAQSACAHDGAPLANYWLHNGFLSMGGGDKMSKSRGNVVTVADLLAQGWHGEVIRLALLSAHYRQPLEWSDELLWQSQSTLSKLIALGKHAKLKGVIRPPFLGALSNDLNIPAAVAELAKLAGKGDEDGLGGALELLGFNLEAKRRFRIRSKGAMMALFAGPGTARPVLDEVEAEQRLSARLAARARRDFAEADRIRDELAAAGILLEDRPDGTTDWRRA